MNRTLCIGDVHGNLHKLAALYELAHPDPSDEVVQLGDLGQFDLDSRAGDLDCYRFARDHNIIVLWGNHDRAAVDRGHSFMGYYPPETTTRELFAEVTMRLAHVAHGYLLTHAGLSNYWHAGDGERPAEPMQWLDAFNLHPKIYVDPIGYARGGTKEYGGILWRDDNKEGLYEIPQVYGHTAHPPRIRKHRAGDATCWCIDVGSKRRANLAGLWLPDLTPICVGPDAPAILADIQED